jgi:hypothetical protein
MTVSIYIESALNTDLVCLSVAASWTKPWEARLAWSGRHDDPPAVSLWDEVRIESGGSVVFRGNVTEISPGGVGREGVVFTAHGKRFRLENEPVRINGRGFYIWNRRGHTGEDGDAGEDSPGQDGGKWTAGEILVDILEHALGVPVAGSDIDGHHGSSCCCTSTFLTTSDIAGYTAATILTLTSVVGEFSVSNTSVADALSMLLGLNGGFWGWHIDPDTGDLIVADLASMSTTDIEAGELGEWQDAVGTDYRLLGNRLTWSLDGVFSMLTIQGEDGTSEEQPANIEGTANAGSGDYGELELVAAPWKGFAAVYRPVCQGKRRLTDKSIDAADAYTPPAGSFSGTYRPRVYIGTDAGSKAAYVPSAGVRFPKFMLATGLIGFYEAPSLGAGEKCWAWYWARAPFTVSEGPDGDAYDCYGYERTRTVHDPAFKSTTAWPAPGEADDETAMELLAERLLAGYMDVRRMGTLQCDGAEFAAFPLARRYNVTQLGPVALGGTTTTQAGCTDPMTWESLSLAAVEVLYDLENAATEITVANTFHMLPEYSELKRRLELNLFARRGLSLSEDVLDSQTQSSASQDDTEQTTTTTSTTTEAPTTTTPGSGGGHVYQSPCTDCDICDHFSEPTDALLDAADWDSQGTPGWQHDGLGFAHIPYGDGTDYARAVHKDATDDDSHWAELRDVRMSDNSGNQLFIYVRMSSADASGTNEQINADCYFARIDNNTTNTARIYKRVSGVSTQLASVNLASGWFGESQDLLLRVSGTTIRLNDISGDIDLNTTDSSVAAGEYVGISGALSGGSVQVGNFCAGDGALPCQWVNAGFEPDTSYTCTADDDFSGTSGDDLDPSDWDQHDADVGSGAGGLNDGDLELDGSGYVRCVAGTSIAGSWWNARATHKTTMGGADHWAEIQDMAADGTNGLWDVFVRVDAATDDGADWKPTGDWYQGNANKASNIVRLYKQVGGAGGTRTLLASVAPGASWFTSNPSLLLQASGTSITLKDKSGTVNLGVTDSSVATGNYTGFFLGFQSTSSYARIGGYCAGTGNTPTGYGTAPDDGEFSPNWRTGGDPGMTIEDNKALVEYDDGDDTGVAVNLTPTPGTNHWLELHQVDIEAPAAENAGGYRDARVNMWLRLPTNGINETGENTLDANGYRLCIVDYGSSSYGASGVYLTRHYNGIVTLLASDTSANVGTVKNWFLRVDGSTIFVKDSDGDVDIEVIDSVVDVGNYVGFEGRRRGTDSGTVEIGNMCAGTNGQIPGRYRE